MLFSPAGVAASLAGVGAVEAGLVAGVAFVVGLANE